MRLAARFRRTSAAARLAVVAVVAVAAALVTGRAAALALCTPPLVLLALGARRQRPAEVAATVRLDPPRCVEGDEVTLHVEVRLPRPVEQIEVRAACRLPVVGADTRIGVRVDGLTARFTVRPDRWGRWNLGTARVTLLGPGAVERARVDVPLGDLVAYPRAVPLRRPPRPARLPQLVGDHVVAARGSGVEFAGIRPYQATDPVRLVHWAATARHGRPYVVERHTERLADVVLLVDAYSELGEPGATSLDVAVRAATSLAEAWLSASDRVGLVTLGGTLRWLPPGLGGRYLYQITDSIVETRHRTESAGAPRIPPPALPPGALVVVLSPLVDPRVEEVLSALGERGMPMLVLDTLPIEPDLGPGFPAEPATRLWRAERALLTRRLTELGAVVSRAARLSTLDAALELARRHPPGGRSR